MAEYIKHDDAAQRVPDHGHATPILDKMRVLLAVLQVPVCAT